MELNTLNDMQSFFDGFQIPEDQAELLKLESAWRQSEPVTNIRSRIAGLAQAFAAVTAAAAAAAAPRPEENGEAGPSNVPGGPSQRPEESIQASAGPAPRTDVEAARDVVGAMAKVLGGGSPSKSDERAQAPRISPLGAQIPATQAQTQEEEPESSAAKRREAAETQAMPPPPPPQQQQQQQQVPSQAAAGEANGFLLPTQPQYLGPTDMDIDQEEPDNQAGAAGENNENFGELPFIDQSSPAESGDIAQLPITQPIPYGGTLPSTLNNNVASVQGEAVYGDEEEEEAEEMSPAKGAAAAAAVAAAQQQQQEEEEIEEREALVSPKARRWLPSFNIFNKKQTPPAGGGVKSPASGGGASGGSKKAATPVFASPPLPGVPRRPLTEGLAASGRNANVASQSLLPTQAQPQTSEENRNNEKDKTTTQETVVIEQIDKEEEIEAAEAAAGDGDVQRTQTMTEDHEINPRDQHLATSIDARMDIGNNAGRAGSGGGGGEGAASPMRSPPFHQPSSVEAIDQEEDDGDVEEGGEVEEAPHGAAAAVGDGADAGVAPQRGAQPSPAGRPIDRDTGFITQRAASSVAQNGANAAAAAKAVFAAAAGGINSLGAALVSGIGLGGPLTQDFYGVTATQEDMDAILGGEDGSGQEEDAGDAIMRDGEEREPSPPPAEPSRGPGIAMLKGRDVSKNAAGTITGGILGSEREEQQHDEDGDGDGIVAEVQTSPEKPLRKSRRLDLGDEEEFSAGGSGGGGLIGGPMSGIVYTKKRKLNPTEIKSKRLTRAQAAAAEAAAAAAATAATGSTGYQTTEAIEVEEEEQEEENNNEEELEPHQAGVYLPSTSMPPPPIVPPLNPALAAARDMPTPRALPTPDAQLPSRTLAAREKLHNLMRQRQMRAAAPSVAGVPQPAGVYQPPAAIGGGGLRVAVPVRRPGADVVSGGGSGPNSTDYRTPMAGQTPVHSVHLGAAAKAAAGGGGGARGGAAARVYNTRTTQQQQQQEQPQQEQQPTASAAGGTTAIWEGYLQRQQQRKQQQKEKEQQQQQSESPGGSNLST